MAETSLTPEEHALRRRARRRLVGAVALALLAGGVRPPGLRFEPRAVGSQGDNGITRPKTPFEHMAAAAA